MIKQAIQFCAAALIGFGIVVGCGAVAPQDDEGIGQQSQAIDVSEGEGLAGWRSGNVADKCVAGPTEHCFLPGQTPGTGKGTFQLYVTDSTAQMFPANYGALTALENARAATASASGYTLTKFGCAGGGTTCEDLVIQSGSVFLGTPGNTNQVTENFVRYSCIRFTPLSAPSGAGFPANCTGTVVTFDEPKFAAWLAALGVPDNTKSAWIQHMYLQIYAHLAGIGTETNTSVNSSTDVMSRTLDHVHNPFNTFLFSEACTMKYTDYTKHVGVWNPVFNPNCSG